MGGELGLVPGCASGAWQCGEELQLAETADGAVVGLTRRPGTPVLSVSRTTGGESFGPAVLLKGIVASSTQTSLLSLRAGAAPFLLMAAPFSPTDRQNLTLSASASDGAAGTWRPVLDLGAGNFSGYSSLAMVDERTLLCLWEGGKSTVNVGENTAIVLSRIDVGLKQVGVRVEVIFTHSRRYSNSP